MRRRVDKEYDKELLNEEPQNNQPENYEEYDDHREYYEYDDYEYDEYDEYDQDEYQEQEEIDFFNYKAEAEAARNGEEGYWDYHGYYHYFDDPDGYYDAEGNYYLDTSHLNLFERIKNEVISWFVSDYDLTNIPVSEKAAKMSDEYLKQIGYPKKKFIIAETNLVAERLDNGVASSRVYYYFNIDNFIEHYRLGFLKRSEKLMYLLDTFTYDNDTLHDWAEKKSKKAVAYNKLSPQQQYSIDERKRKRKMLIASIVAAIFSFVLVFKVIPDYREGRAQNALISGEYKVAHSYYQSKDPDGPYVKIAESFIEIDNGNLDLAEELMKEAKDSNAVTGLIDFQEVYIQFTKKLAKEYQLLGQKDDVARVYREITYDKEGKALYSEAAYEAMTILYDDQEYLKAFDYAKSIAGYKDTTAILEQMSAELYAKAMTLYNQRQYNQSQELFEPLAAINYKNSSTMKTQGEYAIGVNAYLDKDYNRAESILSKIPDFKDSAAILSDLTYKHGLSLFDKNPTEAYPYLYAAKHNADAQEKLLTPQLGLYGKWSIEDRDGVKLNDVTLNFELDGTLDVSEELEGLNKAKYKYSDKESKFISPEGEFVVTIQDQNNVKITLISHDKEINYKLKRIGLPTTVSVNQAHSNPELIESVKDYITTILEEQEEGE